MKIAIIKLSALGDIVHASIILQFIKKHYKNAKIDWFCEERFAEILLYHEDISQIYTLNLKERKIKKSLKTLLLARKNKYDLIIDLQGLIKSALVSRMLGKNIAGFDKFSIRESFAAFFYAKKYSIKYEENIILRNLKLVANALSFDFKADEILQKKPCFESLKSPKKPQEKKQILLAVGSSWRSKIYPLNLQIELVNLLKKYEISLSFATEFEKSLALEIAKKTHAKMLKRQSLRELVLRMNEFDLVIGSDSGVTHIAWAQNISSITIFGPTPYQRNAYETSINKAVWADEIDARNIDKSNDCIKKIKPENIAKLVNELL